MRPVSGRAPETATSPITKKRALTAWVTVTVTCGTSRTERSFVRTSVAICSVVFPAALTSPTTDTVIIPSRRTKTSVLSSGSFQTAIRSTSPGAT